MGRQRFTLASLFGGRSFSTTATFKLPSIIGTHRLDESLLPTEATVSKEELRALFE